MDNALKSWSTTLLVNTDKTNTIDKVILPNSVLEVLISKNLTLPSPLTFVLINKRNNIKIYSGVSEFTAEENEIYLSDTMKNALNVQNFDEIFIRMVELPKCQHVKLEAMSPNISKISNIKALLESYLRKEQTLLYLGQEINVKDWEYSHKFIVKELKPENACIVIDTDVEVDIESAENDTKGFELNNDTRNSGNTNSTKFNKNEIIELPIILKSGAKSINYSINSGMTKTFTIEKDDYYYYKVKIPIHSYICIQIRLSQGDINLYYSFNVEKPDIHNCIGYNVDSTPDRQMIISTEKNVDNFIYFSLQGYSETSTFDISIQEVDKMDNEMNTDDTNINKEINDDKKNDPDYTLCEHCHQYIPSRSITLHSAFCARNNIICEQCNKVFSRNEYPEHWHCDIEDNLKCKYVGRVSDKEKHIAICHSPILCDCGITLPLPEMVEHHRSEQCPERQIICRYCKLKVKAGNICTNLQDVLKGLCEHEAECGSRTIICQQCNASVQMKNIQVHGQLHIMEKKKPPIILCTNKNCSHYKDKKFQNVTSPNSINYLSHQTKGLCATCYGLFWSPRHEMTDAYFSQGILKQYHKQLTVGCGKEFCTNKYCCTSKDPTIPKPMNPTESALLSLELTKKSLSKASHPQFHFCVFEKKNAEQRQIAEEFLVPMNYSIEWCIKALVSVQKQEIEAMTEKEDDDSFSMLVPERTPEEEKNYLVSKSMDWLKINALPIDK
ncbi:hypothetical protein BCR36DRAFT_105593 [Piromyces finnis]|uniref:Uncharacterized protein n=1 Tax=Piromyces finnis TaxID=1754191 RepID=A0A1Y1V4I7_9FUNG|nr:hypothetical protein BCR36DRAFT_105593 [Piromyces finnis]|eukprot:ORX46217.1 hypothetical protein BCR36DRAFT_105593 [Piromyces finnis]